jgi:hypothetical protein
MAMKANQKATAIGTEAIQKATKYIKESNYLAMSLGKSKQSIEDNIQHLTENKDARQISQSATSIAKNTLGVDYKTLSEQEIKEHLQGVISSSYNAMERDLLELFLVDKCQFNYHSYI